MAEQQGLPTRPFMVRPEKGIHPEGALQLLLLGWRVFPGVSMLSPSGLVAVAGGEQVPITVKADLWVPPIQNVIPDSVFAQTLMEEERQGTDLIVLDRLSRGLLGTPYQAVKAMIEDILRKERESGIHGGDLGAQKEEGRPASIIAPDFTIRPGGKRSVH